MRGLKFESFPEATVEATQGSPLLPVHRRGETSLGHVVKGDTPILELGRKSEKLLASLLNQDQSDD
jgi:hypothetical protein